MNLPYFITWTKQAGATTLELDYCDQYHYYTKEEKLLDLSSTSYQASFGLKNPSIINAMKEQMDHYCLSSPKHTTELKNEVSQKLLNLLSYKDKFEYKVFYTNSGSESIENALKMARIMSGSNKILARKKSYHGASLGALSIGGDWRSQNIYTAKHDTIYIPEPEDDPDAKQLEEIIKRNGPNQIAAICLETITGGNGVIIPTQKWYDEVVKICKHYKIKIILDEVVCGFYRTQKPFGLDHYNIEADFICLAKAISGGHFPIGAVLCSSDVAKYFNTNPLVCGLTHYAHPLGLAAIKAVIEICSKEHFHIQLNSNIQSLASFVKQVKGLGLQCRQIGMLAAIDLPKHIKVSDFYKLGLFVAIQNQTLIIAPILTIDGSLLNSGLKRIFNFLENNCDF